MLRLKELRKKNGYTLKTLGETVGLSDSTISLYECGKRQPSFNTLKKFSDLFGVSIGYIMGYESEPHASTGGEELERRMIKAFRRLDADERRDFLAFLESRAK